MGRNKHSGTPNTSNGQKVGADQVEETDTRWGGGAGDIQISHRGLPGRSRSQQREWDRIDFEVEEASFGPGENPSPPPARGGGGKARGGK